jgi:putative holliday junction resolvase
MRLLGLDVGTKTIGLSVCDEDGKVATPVRTLPRHGGRRDLEALEKVREELGAEGYVLGLPLDLEGEEGDAARRVRALGDLLHKQADRPVHYFDERFSTAAAERLLIEADVRRARRKEVVNHVAATLILQGFLDREASTR